MTPTATAHASTATGHQQRLRGATGDLAALVKAGVIDLDEAERRIAEEFRLNELPDDLAVRVRSDADGLTIDEAEAVTRQRQERLAAWADRIRGGLQTFGRMANGPIPIGLPLSEREASDLTTILDALKGGDYEYLG